MQLQVNKTSQEKEWKLLQWYSIPEPAATEDDLCLQLPRTTEDVQADIWW